MNEGIHGTHARIGVERRGMTGMGVLLLSVLLFGCAGPITVTEYVDGMETGQETVIYDDKGHPEISSDSGYVVDPYAETYSIEKEDFRRHGAGVVPD
jgi:hypothetical protein